MKSEDIRQMTVKEMESNLVEQQRLLTEMRFNHTISPLENPARMRMLRKNIARLNTIILQSKPVSTPV